MKMSSSEDTAGSGMSTAAELSAAPSSAKLYNSNNVKGERDSPDQAIGKKLFRFEYLIYNEDRYNMQCCTCSLQGIIINVTHASRMIKTRYTHVLQTLLSLDFTALRGTYRCRRT